MIVREEKMWVTRRQKKKVLITIFCAYFAPVYVLCGCMGTGMYVCMCECVLVPGEALQQLHTSEGAQRNGGGMHVLVLPFHRRENITLQVTHTHTHRAMLRLTVVAVKSLV